MRPTGNVSSASFSSIGVFQKRRLSGKPSRSRGPGNSSRKKSASWASNERRPFGTILIGGPLETEPREVAELLGGPDTLEMGVVAGGTGMVSPLRPTCVFIWLIACSDR